MRLSLSRTLLLGVLAFAFPVASVQSQEAGNEAWARLQGRTAWVTLGHIEVATGHWGTAHRVAAVAGPPLDPGRIPHPGEVLQVTFDIPLIIHDYAGHGEEFATSPPVDPDWQRDLTGAVLKPGARVVVEEIWKNPDVTNLQSVYARVTPAPR